jgi:hypothetical protein
MYNEKAWKSKIVHYEVKESMINIVEILAFGEDNKYLSNQ